MGIGEKFAIGIALVLAFAFWFKNKDDSGIFW
jgi:hypothetical protein